MGRTPQRAILVILALLAFPAMASARSSRPYSPSEAKSFDAVLSKWTAIAKTPGGAPVFEMQPVTFYRNKQQRLLVLEATQVDGTTWLDVRLPAWFSHGMTSGWLKADRVKLAVNHWRVEVSRAAGTLKIVHDGNVVDTAHVGTGTDSTPTPVGLHATYDHWRSTEGVLGDWTVSLTTNSPQVPVFDGQQAVVAIHGWHASGGSSGSVSHGCIRVANDSLMRTIALRLPMGTPVQVT
jgi:lipoprotein-anchoring transpeptidase ErfK/SrfK